VRSTTPIEKEHKEFQPIDLEGDGWYSLPGYPRDIERIFLI
jgi:hypothetical protein